MPKNKKSAAKSAASVAAAASAVGPLPVVVQEEEKKQLSKRIRDEIDEIFASKTTKKKQKQDKKPDNLKPPHKEPAKDAAADTKRIKSKNYSKREIGGDPPAAEPGRRRPRKRTRDGLSIYTEEELGIGKADAGGTPLCPFDCHCCF